MSYNSTSYLNIGRYSPLPRLYLWHLQYEPVPRSLVPKARVCVSGADILQCPKKRLTSWAAAVPISLPAWLSQLTVVWEVIGEFSGIMKPNHKSRETMYARPQSSWGFKGNIPPTFLNYMSQALKHFRGWNSDLWIMDPHKGQQFPELSAVFGG